MFGHSSMLCLNRVNSLPSKFSTLKKYYVKNLGLIESLSLVTWRNVESFVLNLFAATAATIKTYLRYKKKTSQNVSFESSVFCCGLGQPHKIPSKKILPIPLCTYFLKIFNYRKHHKNRYTHINTK